VNWTAAGKTDWALQVSKVEDTPIRSTTTGTLTIRSPRNGTITNFAINATSTAGGGCTLDGCGAGPGGAPVTVTAGTPLTCGYTCALNVTGVTVSMLINGFALSTAATVVAKTDIFFDTECVRLIDPLFSQTEPAAWVTRTICQNSPATAFQQFTFSARPPAPGAGQCAEFDDLYTFSNTALLTTALLGVPAGSSTAPVTVPCPKPGFGAGGAVATASVALTRNWLWNLTALVMADQDATGKIWWRNALTLNELNSTLKEVRRRRARPGAALPAPS
jgi:hypothetical protein